MYLLLIEVYTLEWVRRSYACFRFYSEILRASWKSSTETLKNEGWLYTSIHLHMFRVVFAAFSKVSRSSRWALLLCTWRWSRRYTLLTSTHVLVDVVLGHSIKKSGMRRYTVIHVIITTTMASNPPNDAAHRQMDSGTTSKYTIHDEKCPNVD